MYSFLHSGPLKILCCLFAVTLWLSTSYAQKGASAQPLSVPRAADSVRVDYLNNLSYQYITREQKDSALHYARLAYTQAQEINYAHGKAVSLMQQAQIAKHFDDDFPKSEKLGRASLQWFEKTPNKGGIDTLYNYLIYTVFAQGRFDEALHYTQRMYALAKQNGNQLGILHTLSWTFAIYRQSGDYEKSFEYVQQILALAQKVKSKVWIMHARYGLAQLYMLIEDYPHALYYFRQVLQTDDEDTRKDRVLGDIDIWFKMEFAEVFSNLKNFDSAWHYYRLYKPENDKAVYLRVYWVSTGECYLLQRNYEVALQNFAKGLAAHQQLNDRNEIMRTYLDLGKTYLALNQNDRALHYGQLGLNIALQTRAKQYMRDGYQVLSTVYDRRHQVDSADFYFRRYARMKEAVVNDQTKGKLASYKYEQQIALINKEKELQSVQLQKESFIQKVLVAGLALLVLLGVIMLRNMTLKRRNEKQRLEHELALERIEAERNKAEFQQRTTDLQMLAMRAQMNPHFIFNSLNSINHFILQNDRAQASEYLIKFSRLVRLILQNSQRPLISLDSELEALQLYLELETVRFDHHFDYHIAVDEEVDTTALQVPPLIIQPYVENAVWHGLMNKEEKGHIDIEILYQDQILCCKITDDGIGRKKAAELKSKSAVTYKSMGLQITADRIALMHKEEHLTGNVVINDLVADGGGAAGTEVILKLPVRYAQSHIDRR